MTGRQLGVSDQLRYLDIVLTPVPRLKNQTDQKGFCFPFEANLLSGEFARAPVCD